MTLQRGLQEEIVVSEAPKSIVGKLNVVMCLLEVRPVCLASILELV